MHPQIGKKYSIPGRPGLWLCTEVVGDEGTVGCVQFSKLKRDGNVCPPHSDARRSQPVAKHTRSNWSYGGEWGTGEAWLAEVKITPAG